MRVNKDHAIATCLPLIALCVTSHLTACTVWVRTPAPPRIDNLQQLDSRTATRDDVEIALGAPQSIGIHRIDRQDEELSFYYSLIGKMGVFSHKSKMDLLTAFVSYDASGSISDILSFTSRFSNPKITMGTSPPIGEVLDNLVLGKTSAAEIGNALSLPGYVGRRVANQEGIDNEIRFWDGSESKGGVLAERWLLIGIDPNGVIQDIMWVSSFSEDLSQLGEVQPQVMRSISKLDAGYPFSYWQPETVSTSTRIDPVQVEALLRKAPATIDEYVAVLGKPTARGFKSFQGGEPLVLSHWSYLTTTLMGSELGPSLEKPTIRGDPVRNVRYRVLNLRQTRLIVGHTSEGLVREIYWLRPVNRAAMP